jgi:recombination protein RecT
MTEVPQQLVALAESQKPTEYAMGLVDYYQDDVKRALNYEMISNPRGGPLSYDSFLAAVKIDVAGSSGLQEAMQSSPGSLIQSLLLAAQCKLLPGGAYDLFYLIPRWNGKRKCKEVTPLIGYRGLADMAQRHPRVHKVEAHLVYEGESFEYDPGLGKLSHKVNMLGDRDPEKVVGGYARVVITEPTSSHPVLDDPVIHVMNRKEIDRIMTRSEAYKNAEKPPKWGGPPQKNSPWHTDWKPMARKTLIRAVLNSGSVPRDMGVGGAIQADDQADLVQAEVTPTIPKVSRQDEIRSQLGIDSEPEPFGFAEEAVEAIKGCETLDALAALKPRIQDFQGADADTVAVAYADREELLDSPHEA